MYFTILALIFVTVAAAFALAHRLAQGRVIFDATPDTPAPFGYRMAWVAVRTRDTARVIEVLGLRAQEQANWRTGIGTVYDARLGEAHLYVTPPINGWTFVVGQCLPQPLGGGFVDKCTPMMLDLAAKFPEAQYFLSSPAIEFYAWARVFNGKLVRAFAIGDEGIIWNKGKATPDERNLGLKLTETKNGRGRKAESAAMLVYPTEAHVMYLAGCWSLDPTSIASKGVDRGAGYICIPPGKWRPERMRKTA